MDDHKLLFQQMMSRKKLERDRGVLEIQRHLETIDPDTFIALTEFIVVQASSGHSSFEDLCMANISDSQKDDMETDTTKIPWEFIHATLTAFKLLLSHPWATKDFHNEAKKCAVENLTHSEYRVRIAAGECLGELCRQLGAEVYNETRSVILSGIKTNLDRHIDSDESIENQISPPVEMGASPRTSTLMLAERLANAGCNDPKQIFHDTAGWKNLETFMKCLQSVIDGCGVCFNDKIDQELLDLIFTALTHTNRFVRETGYQVCGALVSCNSQTLDQEARPDSDKDSIRIFGHQFAEHLAAGLADNWSQVRLAASQATRQFLSAHDSDTRCQYYSLMLPRMCLNRYYVAEGVRIFSQETWRRITQDQGKELVELYIEPTVEFYISQSEADNHAVREAACACIAELGTKINKHSVQSYVPRLLESLKICFEDDSWPVRDAACLASGNFIQNFPQEAKTYMPDLKPMFYENLQDNIPSVRAGAAQALTSVAQTYGEEVTCDMLKLIEESLKAVESQKANTDKYSALEKGPATYSVVKRARDNDADLHSNNTMYSCGSLAPKMGRGGGSKDKGGCMHSTFRRPAEPWEKAEGCIHLMAELSQIASLHQSISSMLPTLATSLTNREYTQHVILLETMCKRLPQIARNVGKRHFKPHLEIFLEAVFYSLSCDNALTASAASQCLNHLSNYLGPNILRGRVENYNPNLLSQLEANIMVAPM